MLTVPIQTLGRDTVRTTVHEIHHIIETEINLTIELEAIQIIEISVNKTIDQEIIHTTGPIIKDPMTITIKIDHETVNEIGIQTITISKEIIPVSS